MPVHNIEEARKFYGDLLGFKEGRSSTRWVDYDFFGNQFVVHLASEEYKGTDYFNSVDGDEVPVPHFGACLQDAVFDELAEKLK